MIFGNYCERACLNGDAVTKVTRTFEGSFREKLTRTRSMQQNVLARTATAQHAHFAAMHEKHAPCWVAAPKQHLAAVVILQSRKPLQRLRQLKSQCPHSG